MLIIGQSLLGKCSRKETKGVAEQSFARTEKIKHVTHGCPQPFISAEARDRNEIIHQIPVDDSLA